MVGERAWQGREILMSGGRCMRAMRYKGQCSFYWEFENFTAFLRFMTAFAHITEESAALIITRI